MGYRIYGVEISTPMVQHASMVHQQHGMQGGVIEGDIFKLDELLPEIPDLVACIRFAYYFGQESRLKLLHALARASRRYVLIQYKTDETFKGRRNLARQLKSTKPRKNHLLWHFVSRHAIENEFHLANLTPLKICKIGPFSDRVYILAEKKTA